jgi:hypothetical protein
MATTYLQVGTQIRFCVSGSFSPADPGTDWTIGTPTDVALTLGNSGGTPVQDGAARQSAKADLTASRAPLYEVLGCVDFTGETPTTGDTVDYYWAPSTSATTGSGNVAGNSGTDAGAPDGALGTILLAEFLQQCIYIGSLVVHDGGSVQNGYVGTFSPPGRYGQLVVVNNSGDQFENDDVEMHQVMNPILPVSS